MAYQFNKHYTRDDARALLPQVRAWLRQLEDLRRQILKHDQRLARLTDSGRDAGGERVNAWVKAMAEFRGLFLEFQQREIQIKDLDRGLVDFPAIIAGREVYLCWEKGEDDIAFWHDLDTGHAGRERL
jgi:hypothetical protein